MDRKVVVEKLGYGFKPILPSKMPVDYRNESQNYIYLQASRNIPTEQSKTIEQPQNKSTVRQNIQKNKVPLNTAYFVNLPSGSQTYIASPVQGPSTTSFESKGNMSVLKKDRRRSPGYLKNDSVENFIERDLLEKGLEVLHNLDVSDFNICVSKVMDIVNFKYGDAIQADLQKFIGVENYKKIALGEMDVEGILKDDHPWGHDVRMEDVQPQFFPSNVSSGDAKDTSGNAETPSPNAVRKKQPRKQKLMNKNTALLSSTQTNQKNTIDISPKKCADEIKKRGDVETLLNSSKNKEETVKDLAKYLEESCRQFGGQEQNKCPASSVQAGTSQPSESNQSSSQSKSSHVPQKSSDSNVNKICISTLNEKFIENVNKILSEQRKGVCNFPDLFSGPLACLPSGKEFIETGSFVESILNDNSNKTENPVNIIEDSTQIEIKNIKDINPAIPNLTKPISTPNISTFEKNFEGTEVITDHETITKEASAPKALAFGTDTKAMPSEGHRKLINVTGNVILKKPLTKTSISQSVDVTIFKQHILSDDRLKCINYGQSKVTSNQNEEDRNTLNALGNISRNKLILRKSQSEDLKRNKNTLVHSKLNGRPVLSHNLWQTTIDLTTTPRSSKTDTVLKNKADSIKLPQTIIDLTDTPNRSERHTVLLVRDLNKNWLDQASENTDKTQLNNEGVKTYENRFRRNSENCTKILFNDVSISKVESQRSKLEQVQNEFPSKSFNKIEDSKNAAVLHKSDRNDSMKSDNGVGEEVVKCRDHDDYTQRTALSVQNETERSKEASAIAQNCGDFEGFGNPSESSPFCREVVIGDVHDENCIPDDQTESLHDNTPVKKEIVGAADTPVEKDLVGEADTPVKKEMVGEHEVPRQNVFEQVDIESKIDGLMREYSSSNSLNTHLTADDLTPLKEVAGEICADKLDKDVQNENLAVSESKKEQSRKSSFDIPSQRDIKLSQQRFRRTLRRVIRVSSLEILKKVRFAHRKLRSVIKDINQDRLDPRLDDKSLRYKLVNLESLSLVIKPFVNNMRYRNISSQRRLLLNSVNQRTGKKRYINSEHISKEGENVSCANEAIQSKKPEEESVVTEKYADKALKLSLNEDKVKETSVTPKSKKRKRNDLTPDPERIKTLRQRK